MAIKRWSPSQIVSRQEKFILGRLKRNGKLYAFLRMHRDPLFDDVFQLELEAMYRDTGAGKDAHPPALLAMVLLLQSYAGASDATAVELSLLDLRWQNGAGLPRCGRVGIFARRPVRLPREADRRQPRSPTARTELRARAGNQGVRPQEAAEVASRRDGLQSSRRRGSRRGHDQSARACWSKDRRMRRTVAGLDRDASVS